MGYGIGRIPADSDDADYIVDKIIDAIDRGWKPPARTESYRRCPQCGTTGDAGAYPFSTYGAMARSGKQICDDCGA